ncbi:hypothetical protein E2C01_069108 [Portunus trituberculatus]|uniref:Uncharacterized protein n=1 Tax=Portunus trituberculatus TaxID=210409 RepID=A0A5B7I1X7_PORTR|nr:hypothetical protein [Portunus trituberculatus]
MPELQNADERVPAADTEQDLHSRPDRLSRPPLHSASPSVTIKPELCCSRRHANPAPHQTSPSVAAE